MKYIYQEVGKTMNSFWDKFKLSYEYYTFSLLFNLFRFVVSFKSIVKKVDQDEPNAEEIFQFSKLH
jgi:hypothetical protein